MTGYSNNNVSSSQNRFNEEETFTLVHRRERQNGEEELIAFVEPSASEQEPLSPEQAWLGQFFTPWGIGSIFLLLIANTLLTVTQQTNPQIVATVQAPKPTTEVSLGNLNSSLNLSSLSTIPAESATAPTLVKLPTQPTSQKSPQPVTKIPSPPPPPSNLTKAILPPSLQPQLMPTYPLSVAPSVSQTPVSPIINQPLPPPPSSQTSLNHLPTPTATITSQNPNTQLIEQQQRVDLMRIEQENPPLPTFNQQAKAKLQAAQQPQQVPDQLIQELQQLNGQAADNNTSVSTDSVNTVPIINHNNQIPLNPEN